MLNRDDVLQQAVSLPPTDHAFVADMPERQIVETQSIPLEISDHGRRKLTAGLPHMIAMKRRASISNNRCTNFDRQSMP